MKISQDGTLTWHRQHVVIKDNDVQDSGLRHGYGLTLTNDGGFIVAGEYFSGQPSAMFPTPVQTGVVIKLDEYGCLEPDCHILSTNNSQFSTTLELHVYPNPTSGVLKIVSDEVMEQIEIVDVMGKTVYNSEFLILNSELDISHLAEGVYYLKVLYANGSTSHQRIVKQ
jgi:hypothetical protein